jgi:cystathionine beta-lyase
MAATESAYRYGGKYLDALLDYLKANRDRVTAWCAEELPDAVLSPVEATYLAWLDLRAYSGSEEELKDRFRECGVSLTMGTFFGKPYEGFARLNFGCPRTQLDLGLSRLRDALRR